MSSLTEQAATLAENAKDYIETRVDLVKLEVAEKVSLFAGNVAAILVIAVLVLCFIAFAGVGLALLIGNWVGHMWAGFVIVSLAYGLKAILLWKMRERLVRIPVMNHLLKLFFHEDQTGKE